MEPTHPDRLVENVTAPSAGGFPGPDGENSRRGGMGSGVEMIPGTGSVGCLETENLINLPKRQGVEH
ncbi:MAG: hypothetical protein ACOX52_06165 [Verrucomicrobiota bacterium]|jgi:hypothetical protein